ncbi:MAG: GntR family transcriptional regulator [Thermodesulfobacteriota bacterium]
MNCNYRDSGILNHGESTPLYRQLLKVLRRQIEEGKIKPEQQIPSERSLCEKYRVSRITVRQAIAELINEGLIYKKQGKGTYVQPKKVNQGLVRFVNFAKTVLELGLRPSTRILKSEIVPADVQTAKLLEIPLTSHILKLSLLGLGDEEPLVFYESSFPLSLGKKMAKEAMEMQKLKAPFSTYDLYNKAGVVLPRYVVQTFEATVADASVSMILKVKRGFPIFKITSIFQTNDSHPLEFRIALYRGDRYKFHITREFS